VAAVPPTELTRLPTLYRAALSSLSVARTVSLDRNTLMYLEGLALRGYLCVYSVRATVTDVLADFFTRALPAAVRRASGAFVIAFLTTLAGVLAAFALTSAQPEYYHAFISPAMQQGRSPTTSTEVLRSYLYSHGSAVDELQAFASFLFTHNARIGMLCFALGFALGVPTLALLFINGLSLGAFLALYDSRGLLGEVGAWLSIHGTTEFLAILLCGTAGLRLSSAIIFPGPQSRLASLGQSGREAAVIVLGAVLLFFVAGLLEGLGRQLINDVGWRYLIGWGALAGWAAWFLLAGRTPRARMVPR
jgi:uncharacterized membrane protein SpoIIM required for sporulation